MFLNKLLFQNSQQTYNVIYVYNNVQEITKGQCL